jgi:hemoglobin
MRNTNPTLYQQLGGETVIRGIVTDFYDRLFADYRLNRFFNNANQAEQMTALTTLVIAASGGTTLTAEEFHAVLEDYFMAAFARSKRKSMVGASDFGFFGYIIEQDHPSTNYLCEGHSHLLKFMPDNSHYEAVLEHLTASLQSFKLDNLLINNVLHWAAQARNPVLGQ